MAVQPLPPWGPPQKGEEATTPAVLAKVSGKLHNHGPSGPSGTGGGGVLG